MAIRSRRLPAGRIVHANNGTYFTSWVFGEKIRTAGLIQSFGTIGDGPDNAMMESFWSSVQIELLARKKWHTRVEPSNATGSQSVGQVKLEPQRWGRSSVQQTTADSTA